MSLSEVEHHLLRYAGSSAWGSHSGCKRFTGLGWWEERDRKGVFPGLLSPPRPLPTG